MSGTGRTILVTGAAGFIGSHAAGAFAARGDRVIGIDNFDPFYDRRIKQANLDAIARTGGAGRITFIECDFCDRPALERVLREHAVSSIVHLGARAGVRPSVEQPALYARVNVEGTSNVLEAARGAGTVQRVVMASSSSVYGLNARVPFSESDEVAAPISPYAATKRACELLTHVHHHLYGMPVACLRFFTVFGPRQRPDLAIALFLGKVSKGERIMMYGSGDTSRDYTYIDDIVAGVLAAHDRIDEHGHRIWNLGGSHPVTLGDMIETIGRVVGRPPVIERAPARPGDVERTFADLSRSSAELGYVPRTGFEEGVRRQWAWMQSNR